MKIQLRDRFISLFFLILSIGAFLKIRTFPEISRTFPTYVALVLGLLSLSLFISSLNSLNYKEVVEEKDEKTGEVEEVLEEVEEKKIDPDGRKRVITTLLSTFLYILVLNWLGFYVTSFLFMIGLFLIFRVENKLAIILTPIFTVGFVYFIFKVMLIVPTPEGLFF